MTDTVTLYRADDGWRWRYEASGRVLGDSGQGYSRRIDAVKGACRVLGIDKQDADRAIRDLRLYSTASPWRTRSDWTYVRFVIEATR